MAALTRSSKVDHSEKYYPFVMTCVCSFVFPAHCCLSVREDLHFHSEEL